MSSPVRDERIQTLNDAEPRESGEYVLYWMEASQRADRNEALELAARRANEHGLRLLAAAVLDPDEPEVNGRHAAFAVQGYRDTAARLSDRKIKFALRTGPAVETVAGSQSGVVKGALEKLAGALSRGAAAVNRNAG